MTGSKAVRALVVDDDPSVIGEYRCILCAENSASPEADSLFSALDSDLFGAAINHKQFPAVDLAAFRMGSEAVDAVRESRKADRPFSIAFIDMQLNAGLNGIETAERIRASDAQIHIAVVAGRSLQHPVELVARIPPADRLSFVRKPFHPFEVQQLLLGCLHRQRVEALDPLMGTSGERGGNRSILRTALDQLPVGVLVFDRRDELVLANAEMGRLYSDSASLFVPGMRQADIFREFNPHEVVKSGAFGEQRLWQLWEGRWAMVMEGVAPNGETYCLFCDVTDLKNRDAARRRSKSAAHLTRVFSTLCGTVGGLVPDGTATTENAKQAIDRLRTVAKQQYLTPRVVRLSQYLSRSVRRIRRRLPEGIGLEMVIDAKLWPVDVDSEGLSRVLSELTANACEAMPGGGRIIVEASNVRHPTDRATAQSRTTPGDYVRLSVQDTGQGMPQDWISRSLIPFQSQKQPPHLGLGLTIVHAFAIESGGWLDVEGGAGSGATIHLYLPKVAMADASDTLAPVVKRSGDGFGEKPAEKSPAAASPLRPSHGQSAPAESGDSP